MQLLCVSSGSRLDVVCLMMAGHLILDVCSLALHAFFTFNREDTRRDKGTRILGTLE